MLNTDDCRNAVAGEGPLAAVWQDKPHRLVYDLCCEVDRLRRHVKPATVQWLSSGCDDLYGLIDGVLIQIFRSENTGRWVVYFDTDRKRNQFDTRDEAKSWVEQYVRENNERFA